MRRTTSAAAAFLLLIALAAGTVAAQDLSDQAPRGNWDTVDSTGEIILDDESYYRVYQGERGITAWRTVDGADVTGEWLDGESGAAEGRDLDLIRSIPRDQAPGRYSRGNVTTRVSEPRITSVDIYNMHGAWIRRDATVPRRDMLLVVANSNFAEAEDLELTVRERDQWDVTREALSTEPTSRQRDRLPSGFDDEDLAEPVQGTGSTGFERGYWLIDPANLDRTRHTITIAGVEDLDFGPASSSFHVSVEVDTRPSLSLERTTVTQGSNARFDVRHGEVGTYHAVAVDRDRLRDGATADRVFRNVGETVETGATDTHAYAVLEIDGRASAAGQIDTTHLAVGTADMKLYEPRDSVSSAVDTVGRSGFEIESRSLDVERGEIEVSVRGLTYVTGASIDITGTASPGVDEVVVYARDRGDWHILPLNGRETHSVDADGRWGERNVVLSDEDYGGRLFRLPGSYSIAAVDAADLDSPPPRTISSGEFNRLTTSRTHTRVSAPTFVGNVDSYAGQVALNDRVSFSGVSVGPRTIAVGFVSERGKVTAHTVRTTRGDLFDGVNLDLGEIGLGRVTMIAASPGRDGVYGDGRATDGAGDRASLNSPEAFRDYMLSFDDTGRTRTQIVSRIRDVSVDRAGTDDIVRTQEFRVTSPRTTVRDVVPDGYRELEGPVAIERGERMVVRGTTNRNPADTQIEVEIEGPDYFEDRAVTSWDASGLWSTEYSTEDLAVGEYTVRVDDGRTTDSLTFNVVEERPADALADVEELQQRLQDLRQQRDELQTSSQELREEIEELEQERDRLLENISRLEEEEPSPGFTFVAALLAILVVAAAAGLRRRRT